MGTDSNIAAGDLVYLDSRNLVSYGPTQVGVSSITTSAGPYIFNSSSTTLNMHWVGSMSLDAEPLEYRLFLSNLLAWLLKEHPEAFQTVSVDCISLGTCSGIGVPQGPLRLELKSLFAEYRLVTPEDAPRILADSHSAEAKRLIAHFLLECA